MFKYLLAIAVCLICLILLQKGCKGFGERFRERIDERKQQRQDRWGDRKQIFGHDFWQRRGKQFDDKTTFSIED